MCGNKYRFIELEELNDHVTFGDDSNVKVKGNGKTLVQVKNREHLYIFNVFYVLSMKTNILFGPTFGERI